MTDTVQWVRFAEQAKMVCDPGHAVVVENREIAVFELDGGYVAIDAGCRHEGASLAEGDQEGGKVNCPWHGWCYDLRTGVCDTVAEDSVNSYPVRLVDGWVEVGLPGS